MVEQRNDSDEPLIGMEQRSSYDPTSPFTVLSSLITQNIKQMAIPGQIIRLRNTGMIVTTIALLVSFYEMLRYTMEFGPLPAGDKWVCMWMITCLVASVVGVYGTFSLK